MFSLQVLNKIIITYRVLCKNRRAKDLKTFYDVFLKYFLKSSHEHAYGNYFYTRELFHISRFRKRYQKRSSAKIVCTAFDIRNNIITRKISAVF